jgi:DedD protein
MAIENGMTENEDVRRRALLRLSVAGVVTATALAGLWWLDQGGSRKPAKPAPLSLPAPIVTAPLQASAPPQTPPGETPPVPEQQAREPGIPAAAAKPQAAFAPSEPPPPPKVSNAPKTLSVPVAPRPAPRAAPAQSAATQPASTGERFVVQLGVFSNPERARELVNKLNKQGIHAHMETRVQLGPFANREEAEKAQAEMRKLGMQALVTPVSATK